jgi:hypothetical protein
MISIKRCRKRSRCQVGVQNGPRFRQQTSASRIASEWVAWIVAHTFIHKSAEALTESACSPNTAPVWRPRPPLYCEKPVSRTHLAPAIARLQDTGRRFGRKSFHQFHRPPVEAGVAKIQSREFLLDPLLCRFRHAPARIVKVNAICSKITSPAFKSLNVKISSI